MSANLLPCQPSVLYQIASDVDLLGTCVSSFLSRQVFYQSLTERAAHTLEKFRRLQSIVDAGNA